MKLTLHTALPVVFQQRRPQATPYSVIHKHQWIGREWWYFRNPIIYTALSTNVSGRSCLRWCRHRAVIQSDASLTFSIRRPSLRNWRGWVSLAEVFCVASSWCGGWMRSWPHCSGGSQTRRGRGSQDSPRPRHCARPCNNEQLGSYLAGHSPLRIHS